jgi:hypothetical protein
MLEEIDLILIKQTSINNNTIYIILINKIN